MDLALGWEDKFVVFLRFSCQSLSASHHYVSVIFAGFCTLSHPGISNDYAS